MSSLFSMSMIANGTYLQKIRVSYLFIAVKCPSLDNAHVALCFTCIGISTSRKLLAGSSEETPEKKVVPNRSKVQAALKNIKQSPKKVNLVAALVRGMRVEDALLQLQVTVKSAAKTVYQVIHSARANATHNHGLDPDRLLVERPECRLTVVVREMTPKEEAELARLRVSKFRKLTKRERRLVPHKLIETTPRWNRKGKAKAKASSQEPNGMAA
ncbi:hypothetical protein CRYUN_Cryun05aG0211900 [Craigia yunnanensis]